MTDAEETKRAKAKRLRYKKPIAKDLNLESIKESLWEITDACCDVQYYVDTDEETLINALDGDEDEAYEFKMMFADLAAECEQMQNDLETEYIPEYFDIFFAAVNKDGEMLGYDTYEHDYYGLGIYESCDAKEEASKKIKQLTKDQMIEAMRFCFGVYKGYIGLRYRYDCIKSAIDILRDQNTGYIQMVKEFEELYQKADEETEGFKWEFSGRMSLKKLDAILEQMPQEAWIQ